MSQAILLSLALIFAGVSHCALAANGHVDKGDEYKEQVIQADERVQALAKLNLDAFPEVKKLLEQRHYQAAIALLDQMLPQYENDPSYFNLLGVLHLQQKSYHHAASAFERVVLIQSDNAGAWLDLALANAEAGNFAIARQYFGYIESTLQPPPAVSALIAQSRARMRSYETLSRHWSGKLDAQLGFDSNANSGLLDKNITVTFQGGKLEIPIDSSYAARADTFRHVTLQSNYQNKIGGEQFYWNANAVSHHFTNEHQFSSFDFSTNVSLVHRTNALDVGAAINVEHFVLGKQSLLNNHNFSIFFEKNWDACQVNVVFEHEWRRYLRTSILDGDTIWKNLAFSCAAHTTWGAFQNTAIYRHGTDRPLRQRPGGTASRRELIFKTAWRSQRAFRVELSLHLAQAKDEQGYSPLLENNAAREVFRRGYQMQMQIPTKERWSLLINWSRNTSLSNLALFRQRGSNLSLGLQKQF